MTNEEILKKAIKKAVKNGWKPLPDHILLTPENILANYYNLFHPIIFNHDFARAFFGDDSCGNRERSVWCSEDDKFYTGLLKRIPNWQYHLQKMVLREDPIFYLKQFI